MTGNFFDRAAQDIDNVFFKHFATMHKLGDKEMPVVVDSAALAQRKLTFKGDGIYKADYLLYVRKSDFGDNLPGAGGTLVFDGKQYFVKQADDEDGLYVIAIGANRN